MPISLRANFQSATPACLKSIFAACTSCSSGLFSSTRPSFNCAISMRYLDNDSIPRCFVIGRNFFVAKYDIDLVSHIVGNNFDKPWNLYVFPEINGLLDRPDVGTAVEPPIDTRSTVMKHSIDTWVIASFSKNTTNSFCIIKLILYSCRLAYLSLLVRSIGE